MRLEAYPVRTHPLAVLRPHGVGHGTLREVLQRPARRCDGGTGTEGEENRHKRQTVDRPYRKDDSVVVRRDVFLPHLRSLVEITYVCLSFHPGIQYVALIVQRLFLYASGAQQREKTQEIYFGSFHDSIFFEMQRYDYFEKEQNRLNCSKKIFS